MAGPEPPEVERVVAQMLSAIADCGAPDQWGEPFSWARICAGQKAPTMSGYQRLTGGVDVVSSHLNESARASTDRRAPSSTGGLVPLYAAIVQRNSALSGNARPDGTTFRP